MATGLVTLKTEDRPTNHHHHNFVGEPCKFFQHARQSAIAEERHRIARDLHDTVGQAFTGALLQIDVAEELLSQSWAQDKEEVRQHIARARRLVSEGLDEARRYVFALHSQCMKRQNLGPALRRLARGLTRDCGIRTTFSFQGLNQIFSADIELQVLRITQEAITNIVRHAQATAIQVKLAANLGWVTLSIVDNGRGFDPKAPTGIRRFGLNSMQERAAQLGGRLIVRSQPGNGTQVQATLATSNKTPVDENCA